MDKVYCSSLQWILDNDITNVIEETFSVLRDEFGEMTVVDLCPNGRNIDVNEANKSSYVRSKIEQLKM